MENPFKIETYANIAYIKQLRPITPDDFLLVNPTKKSNALDFLVDDPWDIRPPFDMRSTPASFQATIAVEFKWIQDIEAQYNNLIPLSNIENKDQIKGFINSISKNNRDSMIFISHSFDWTGCKTPESRQRKFKKNKQTFEEKFESDKEDKERRVLNTAMKRCINYLDHANDSFSHKLLNVIDYNVENQEDKSKSHLDEELQSLQSQILLLQEKMAPLNKRLREIQDEKFRNRVDQIINIVKKDLPAPVSSKLEMRLEEKKATGYPRRPMFLG
jgi:flagellar motility protein MotE (MotC chaperone)